MNTIDLIIFIAYCLLILCVGLLSHAAGRGRAGCRRLFLAGRGLAWWAIGASIIASNISAEQFVGMSGSGYAIGLAMATYEWIAALGLILVAKFFIPIFGEEDLHHAPVPRRAFRQARQDGDGGLLAGCLHLYQSYFHLVLGSLDDREGDGDPDALRHNRAGGLCRYLFDLRRIEGGGADGCGQVVFLVGGGLVTTYIALDLLGEGGGVYQGMVNLYGEASDKFHLILDKSHPGYKDLPGISVILGGLWVANLYYWGCNQYIIQRALAAKSVREAQNGMLFAGFIKLFIPLLVVIPGIAAFALEAPLEKSDEAYPWLLGNLLPVGVKGWRLLL